MITEEQAKKLRRGDKVHNILWDEVWIVSIPYQKYGERWLVEVVKKGYMAGISDLRMDEWEVKDANSI